jgi:hypothetical protein
LRETLVRRCLGGAGGRGFRLIVHNRELPARSRAGGKRPGVWAVTQRGVKCRNRLSQVTPNSPGPFASRGSYRQTTIGKQMSFSPSFAIFPFTEAEVMEMLEKRRNVKPCDMFGIPYKFPEPPPPPKVELPTILRFRQAFPKLFPCCEPTMEEAQAACPHDIPKVGMNTLIASDLTSDPLHRIVAAAIQCHEKYGNCLYEHLTERGFTQDEIFQHRAMANCLIGMEVYDILNNDARRADGIMPNNHYTADNLDFPAMITFPPDIEALYAQKYPDAPRYCPFKPTPRE